MANSTAGVANGKNSFVDIIKWRRSAKKKIFDRHFYRNRNEIRCESKRFS